MEHCRQCFLFVFILYFRFVFARGKSVISTHKSWTNTFHIFTVFALLPPSCCLPAVTHVDTMSLSALLLHLAGLGATISLNYHYLGLDTKTLSTSRFGHIWKRAQTHDGAMMINSLNMLIVRITILLFDKCHLRGWRVSPPADTNWIDSVGPTRCHVQKANR